MLDKLRDRATQILAETDFCTLATTGPAGIQASMVHCAGRGTTLYVLVPDTSDHLFNLESEPEVAVTAETWHLRGTADIVQDSTQMFSRSAPIARSQGPPVRLHIIPDSGPAGMRNRFDG
jgi:hypothetical protein